MIVPVLFATCRVDNFDCFMRKNIYNFIQRLNNIDNEIVKSVRNCSMYIREGNFIIYPFLISIFVIFYYVYMGFSLK